MANAFGYSWSRDGVRIKVDGRTESDLGLALQGRLDEVLKEGKREIGLAFVRAAKTVAAKGKAKLRADIAGGGFTNGVRLSKTWRGNAYPNQTNAAALDPAVQFKTKARVIIDAFESGATIRVKSAQYLAIPIGPAKAIVRRYNKVVRFSRRDSGMGRDFAGRYSDLGPSAVDRVKAALNVDLVAIVSPDGKAGVLVAAGRKLTPTGRDAKRQDGKSTPLFALVKQATLKKRIRGRAVLNEIAASFEGDFARALMAELPAAYR